MTRGFATGADEAAVDGVVYLSAAWLADADRAVGHIEPIAGAPTVGYRVTGGPSGTVVYRIALGGERVAVLAGAEGADVVLTVTWQLAVAIARGERAAQRAFIDGDIRLEGSPTALLGNAAALAAIDDALAPLRARTTFPSAEPAAQATAATVARDNPHNR